MRRESGYLRSELRPVRRTDYNNQINSYVLEGVYFSMMLPRSIKQIMTTIRAPAAKIGTNFFFMLRTLFFLRIIVCVPIVA